MVVVLLVPLGLLAPVVVAPDLAETFVVIGWPYYLFIK
jgi:hypothetical protein